MRLLQSLTRWRKSGAKVLYGPPHYTAAQDEYRRFFRDGGGGGWGGLTWAASDVVASVGGGGVGNIVEISCCEELLGRVPLIGVARNGSARLQMCLSRCIKTPTPSLSQKLA